MRFSEYTDEWELYSLDDLTTVIQSGKSNKNINAMYNLYGSTGCIGKTNSIEIKGESILIARVGANAGTVQYINDICGVSDNTLIIKLKNDLNYKFLYYSLIIYNFNKIIVNSGRPLITASDLKTIRIQIPSIDEQKKIACFLYNIDKKIELLKDKKEGFVEFKHYLLQNLFPQNDEKTPKLRFTEYNDEWITRKIENIAEICDGTHTTPNYVYSGIKFISVENIDDFSKSNKFIEEEVYQNYKIKSKKNDIFLTRIGTIGESNIIIEDETYAYYVSLALIRCNYEVNPLYLNQYLKSDFFQRELWNKTLHNAIPKKINLKDLKQCFVSFPMLKEQFKIASFLSSVDKKIDLLDQEIELVEEYKKGLLQKMFI